MIHDSVHRRKYPPIAYDTDRFYGSDWLIPAPTIEQLAEKLGIDADGLHDQVEVFNADAERGADSAFARSYTQKLWMRVKRKAAYLPG